MVSVRRAPRVSGLPVDAGVSGYVPGACNIGRAKVERRRRSAVVGGLATAGIAAGMLALHAPRWIRLAITLPAAGTAVAALQVRERFCVAYATRGVQNVAGPLGAPQPVADAESRAADRRRAIDMVGRGVLVGAVLGLAFAALP